MSILPFYAVFPKPGELDNTVHYILTGKRTTDMGVFRGDLRSGARICIPGGRFASGLVFVAVVMLCGVPLYRAARVLSRLFRHANLVQREGGERGHIDRAVFGRADAHDGITGQQRAVLILVESMMPGQRLAVLVGERS